MIIELSKNDISFVNELAEKRGKYSNPKWQQNKYRKGIANSYSDNYYVERLGLYGEIAVSKILKIDVDKEIYESGDLGYDFIYKNIKIDVKCQLNLPIDLYNKNKIYGTFYINATNKVGNYRKYKSDVIVFTSIDSAEYYQNKNKITVQKKDFRRGKDKISDIIKVNVHGFIPVRDILKNKEERKNYRIDILRRNIIPKNEGNIFNFYINENELRGLKTKRKNND